MVRFVLPVALVAALANAGQAADEFAAPRDLDDADAFPKTVCELIDEAAAAHRLPVDFFTRLIWKESRFDPDAISPKGAQGIAQFMPHTAALRGLADPFDPSRAITASAGYLRELSIRFGNLGIAAAAYNAGEERVSDWLAGSTRLPWETRDFVLFITGRTAEQWMSLDATDDADGAVTGAPIPSKCADIAALLSESGAGSALISTMQYERAAWAPWGVQVAGSFSEARAMARYADLRKKHLSLLADRAPLILRTVMRSRGAAPLTQVRLPADTRDEADGLCAQLRKAGAACIVMKNTR